MLLFVIKNVKKVLFLQYLFMFCFLFARKSSLFAFNL